MQINLVTNLKYTMSLFGRSINEFDVTHADDPLLALENIFRKFLFSKTGPEVLSEIVSIKKEICKRVYGVDFCPFEKLTNVSWEELFTKAVSLCEDYENGFKPIAPWSHIVTSSKYYNFDRVKQNKPKIKPLFRFKEVGEESVKIRGTRYICCEAVIVVEKDCVNSDMPIDTSLVPIWSYHPTIVLDEKIIPQLITQPEWPQILEIIYTLFTVSSHSNMVHNLFIETSEVFQEHVVNNDSIMWKLLQDHYYSYNMYELNYSRMMREMFDLMNASNPTLRTDVKALLSQLHELSKNWPFVLREYVRFIATERVARILYVLPDLKLERYLKSFPGPLINITNDKFLYEVIHSHKRKEALIYNRYRRKVTSVSWESMTKFVLDYYPVKK